ncbi:MAG: hypothetical protein HY376_01915 [Candidatus Blackburnbacteria bacterium]|nr:hypothetical protein [Candidatus Blackburnbacteria bacterium]
MPKIVTVGSDPEFVLSEHSWLLDAEQFFVDLLDNNIIRPRVLTGYPYSSSRFQLDLNKTRIGVDGCSTTGELRPPYSDNPLIHFQNVRHSICALDRIVRLSKRRIKVFAGNCWYGEPMGGHLHIGGKTVSAARIDALDTYLAFWLKRIYDADKAVEREENGYGEFGQYRTKPYGFEYRTPASWLVNPVTAKAVICLAKVVGSEAIEHIHEHNEKATRESRPSHIYKELCKFRLYHKYAKYINPLITRSTRCIQWKESENILRTWGFR